jgi:magnesium-transporting ATPase (P-type)
MLTDASPLYLQATTACFSAIIATQIINVFLCKSPGRSVFLSSWINNHIILWGIALELGLLLFIVYAEWGNKIFSTLPLAQGVWFFILPFPLAMLLLEECRKWLAVKLRHDKH